MLERRLSEISCFEGGVWATMKLKHLVYSVTIAIVFGIIRVTEEKAPGSSFWVIYYQHTSDLL